MRQSVTTNAFIIGLAFVDLLVSVLVIPYTAVMEIYGMIRSDAWCKSAETLRYFTVTASVILFTGVACDR